MFIFCFLSYLCLFIILDIVTLQVGEKVCIRVQGNPIPFAVGKSEMDGPAIQSAMQSNSSGWKKGKGVTIIQIFGDSLWQQCRDQLRGVEVHGVRDPMVIVYPNLGFSRQLTIVDSIDIEPLLQLPVILSKAEASDETPKIEEPNEAKQVLSSEVELTDASSLISQVDVEPSCEREPETPQDEVGEIQNSDDPPSLSATEAMDRLLVVCLLRALKYLVKDKDLPLLTSSLWSIVTR